jgi:hypothetical protein
MGLFHEAVVKGGTLPHPLQNNNAMPITVMGTVVRLYIGVQPSLRQQISCQM